MELAVAHGCFDCLLPSALAHALVVLHNTLPAGHETSHNGWMNTPRRCKPLVERFEASLRRHSTVSEAFLRPRIAT
jgi:hypothetical protein